jgi:hypothetical protein
MLNNIKESILEAWSYLCKGELSELIIIVGEDSYSNALTLREAMIKEYRMDIRVITEESLFNSPGYEGEPLAMEKNGMTLISVYEGNLFVKPSVEEAYLTFTLLN